MSLERSFRTPDGIARRVPGVWVLPIPTYFNCCSFFLNRINYRFPYGDQIILISRNGNSSFVTTWTLSYFAGRGRFVSVVHISTVNWRCWLPSALSNVCWNSAIQSLSLVHFSFSWIILVSHLDICRGRLSGLEETWIFQKGKTQPGLKLKPIHIHQLLTLALLFFRRGIRNTRRRSRLEWR